MALLNLGAASSTLMSSAFLQSAVLVVAGSMLAQIATNWMRGNVYDVAMRGGDALYSVVAAMLVLGVMPGRYARPIALGSTATAVRVVADEFGVV